jgi:hypothetical protein
MSARLSGKTPLVLLVTILSMAMTASDVTASGGEPATSDRGIHEVLSSEDFTVHHRYVDVPVKKESSSRLSDWLSGLHVPEFMGALGTVFFYLLLVGLLVGLGILIYRNRHIFERWGGEKKSSAPKTTAVMGMDVTPESLPEDIVNAARQAWRNGEEQQALSLLYRGAIVWLIHRADVPIAESDTEGDCLNRVTHIADREKGTYFSELTWEWIAVAYGKTRLRDEVIETLCERWPFDDASSTSKNKERSIR